MEHPTPAVAAHLQYVNGTKFVPDWRVGIASSCSACQPMKTDLNNFIFAPATGRRLTGAVWTSWPNTPGVQSSGWSANFRSGRQRVDRPPFLPARHFVKNHVGVHDARGPWV